MEPNRVKFLENKTLLVTGASGFLAKVLVERVLSLQPNVKRLYLLVRASDMKSAKQRLHSEVFEKDLFKVLRNNIGDESLNVLISEKVVPVPGDISLNNMGVSDSNLVQAMMQEIEIVFHAAATTRFDERYDVALRINTFGALNVLNFSKTCVKAQLLLHVSTAYVCGERSGLIQEIPIAMGETLHAKNKVDISNEMQLVEQRLKQLIEQGCSEEETKHAMRDLGLKRAKLFGLPNTYAFTKVMGEMFLGHYRENMPIVIIRPTMITSTFSHPFPGWIEGVNDSEWAGCRKTRRSTGGLYTFLGSNIISWSAKRHPTISRSSTEAEYCILSFTATELKWIASLLGEMSISLPDTPELFYDNLLAVYLTANPALHNKSKHFDTDFHYVRERVALGTLVANKIPSVLQLADIFTKSLFQQPFCNLRDKLGISKPHVPSLKGCISPTAHKAQSDQSHSDKSGSSSLNGQKSSTYVTSTAVFHMGHTATELQISNRFETFGLGCHMLSCALIYLGCMLCPFLYKLLLCNHKPFFWHNVITNLQVENINKELSSS